MSHVAALLVARMGSSRLPGKHLMTLGDKTVMEQLIERIRCARRVERIILCTTTCPADAALTAVAARAGIEYFRGSELNLLQRFRDAAMRFGVDFSVIVEGDEVLCDWGLVDAVADLHRETAADYIAVRGAPLGSYLHGVSTAALQQVCRFLDDADETDGWDRYLTEATRLRLRVEEVAVTDPALTAPWARLTLDWAEDLALLREIFARLYVPGKPFALRDALALLRREPALLAINRHLVQVYADRVAAFTPLPAALTQEVS